RLLLICVFSQGSVAVTFDLWFNQLIEAKEAEQQLGAGLQEAEGGGLVIDRNSIRITGEREVTVRLNIDQCCVSTVTCPPHQKPCGDRSMCVPIDRFCDGVDDCPDSSEEDAALCATACDGQFVLRGASGSFRSSDVSETYDNSSFCRWVIRVDRGFSVRVDFHQFETEENIDTLRLYEGVGAHKLLTGSAPPGTVWLLTDQSTVEFISDDVNNLSGFSATYRATNLSTLSNQEKLTCAFEQGMCFWRQPQDDDDGDWIRTSGSTFPPLTGPSVDHTLGNSSGFYIVTPVSPGQWLKSFRIHSLPLTPPTRPLCLSFWYHMFGEDIHRLRVLLLRSSPSQPEPAITVVFQRDGNYGDNWNYGQVTLNLTDEATVAFEALKKGGMRNDIALDDITLTTDPCGPAPPEPTNVPPPTTTPPIPADCGGPFNLWEPNSTFSSPNYPQSYGNKAQCLWTLHTVEGRNIQLHFLDLNIEVTYDVVEVRDGAGPNSTLLAVLTGSDGPAHDLFSTTNQMTLWFFTDESGHGRGFRANFTSGVNLGSPAPCAAGQFQCQTGSCIHGNSQINNNTDWLLTAAHCVYGKNIHLQSWSAVLGLHSQSDMNSADVQTRRVDRVVINREYNRQSKQADIAMMHLQQPINFTELIQPVCLPAEGQDVTTRRKCFITGWGRVAEQGSLPDVLQQAQVPVLVQDQCQTQLPEYTITSSMLCAGFPEGGVDSCQGDSGGPLMCLDDGRWTQIGVTSFGIGCGRPQRPGVYARVSAFTSWIAQTRRSSPSSPSCSSCSSSSSI
uniref:Transmembrane serine protease 15 n=1 Tax=Lates calcarifer TaxID=8187 RepID=A0A4W6E6S6_LATCA